MSWSPIIAHTVSGLQKAIELKRRGGSMMWSALSFHKRITVSESPRIAASNIGSKKTCESEEGRDITIL